MGIFEDVFLGGDRKNWAGEMEDEAVPDPISNLSTVANSVIHCCSRILGLQVEQLQKTFEAEILVCSAEQPIYGRYLVEYCSYRALHVETQRPDYLAEKEFCMLTFDMMLAWETPDAETETFLMANGWSSLAEIDDEDEGSIFYASITRMASQFNGKRTVGLEAFARIACACPAIADPITVHNLFDALTSTCNGRLHFLIYDKYLKCLYKAFKTVKQMLEPSSINLGEGEIILDVEGFIPTKPVLQHIGISTWPGRLTLTTHALYFEALGVRSYDKASIYDLSKDLKQVIKHELTGPWGARIFDKAVMYKSSSLAEPIFFEFPQFNGHFRRDYWFEIIREILYAHRFIRKFGVKNLQRTEALSIATLGIFRYRAVKEGFRSVPSNLKSTLGFSLAEKLPKGDKILKALNDQLQHMQTICQSNPVIMISFDERIQASSFPDSLYTLTKLGFMLLKKEENPVRHDVLYRHLHVGQTSQVQFAVRESVRYSGRVEAARATVEQVKVEDIVTNLAVVQEFFFPLLEMGKLLQSLAAWEDPFSSRVFLFFILYLLYRGWIRYILPGIFLFLAICMCWHKHHDRKPIKVFQITPPPSRTTMEQLLTLQEVVAQLETFIQIVTVTLLKLRTLVFAAFPQTTNKVAITLVILAAAFAFLPLEHIIVLVLLEAYTREMPLRKESSDRLVRRLRDWWNRIPAAPAQLVRTRYRKTKTR